MMRGWGIEGFTVVVAGGSDFIDADAFSSLGFSLTDEKG
jgi:hypothetical protein